MNYSNCICVDEKEDKVFFLYEKDDQKLKIEITSEFNYILDYHGLMEDNGLKVMETIKGKLTLIDKLDIVNEKTNQTYYFIEEDAQAIESQIEKIKHFVKLLKEN